METLESKPIQPVSKYLNTNHILERFHISKMTLWRKMQKENNPFPKPRIGQQGKGCQRLWAIEDVMDWEQKESMGCDNDKNC